MTRRTDGRTEEEEEDHNGSCCGHEKICDGEREPYLMGEELGELASGLIRTGFVSVMQEGGQIGSSLPSYGLCLLQKPMEEMSGT